MPDNLEKPAASAALDAAIKHSADVVKRGRRRRPFLEKLGLSVPVTPSDVRQAYLEKAKQTHPDHGGDSTEFKAVQAAFDEALAFAQRNGKRLPWIGVQMPLYIAQREIVGLVGKWGGSVEVQQLDWLEDTIGSDFTAIADRLVEINLSNRDIDDGELLKLVEHADGLQFLEMLRLAGTGVTDAGVRKVVAASNLRYLDVRRTKVSSALCKQLSRLPQMDRVDGGGGWFAWLPWR